MISISHAGYNNFSPLLAIKLFTPHSATVVWKLLVTYRISQNSDSLKKKKKSRYVSVLGDKYAR